jgi:hypothetical protein
VESTPTAGPSVTTAPPEPVLRLAGEFPTSGPGTFDIHPAAGPVHGGGGTLRRFRVAVEKGVPESTAEFAAGVDAALGDRRGWSASGRLRLQRVPGGAAHEFTVYLVTPETARRMCAAGGLDIRLGGQPYTSCRTSGRVVINLARWRLSVPEYVAASVPLAAYRLYVINHEVGHQLGHGHERCPGVGRPAPVMQTQTLGLRGCTAYPWPYRDGRRYAGSPA